MYSQFCFSLIFISLILWAEPIILNPFFKFKFEYFKFLLNDGKYTPSKSSILANLILFAKKNLNFFFLQNFLMLIISFKQFDDL